MKEFVDHKPLSFLLLMASFSCLIVIPSYMADIVIVVFKNVLCYLLCFSPHKAFILFKLASTQTLKLFLNTQCLGYLCDWKLCVLGVGGPGWTFP